MFQISVVNRSGTISDRELLRAVRAINRQIAQDFEPYWAFGGRLRVEGATGRTNDLRSLREMRGDAILYIMDSSHSTEALGYHTRNLSDVPCGFVFLDLCKRLGDEWSTTLSHEALELIADPLCNLLVQGPHPSVEGRIVYHYYEMCDAVQAQSYDIDGVTVSNFVLPAYFSESTVPGARTNFCGMELAPFGVTPGGYIGFFDPIEGKGDQFFANGDASARQRTSIKSGLNTSRVNRRTVTTGENRIPVASQRQDLTHQLAAGVATSDPIKHIVVLMMENRSFDHMLGALKAFDPEIDGVDPSSPKSNTDAKTGSEYVQKPDAMAYVGTQFAVPHEHVDVDWQLQDNLGHFVDAYRRANPDASASDLAQVMAYFPDGSLPVLQGLAKQFLICDRWFSSLPGPTWPNRLFVHSGTSMGDVLMPSSKDPTGISTVLGHYTQSTIYNRLDDAKRSWKIYHDGFPQSVILDKLKVKFLTSDYASMDDFKEDAAVGGSFPEYAFIEPRYFDGAFGHENDQHAPAGVAPGEQLIADVYNTLRANEDLWNSTLLIVTYDEHGGLYDHVMPPPTVAPDDHTTGAFAFNQLGVRVPTLLISPWVKRGVDHTVYDHTSILRYLCEKWGMPHLCRRTEPAPGVNIIANFAHAISLAAPRTDTPVSISAAVAAPAVATPPTPFDNARESLVAVGEMLMGQGQNLSPMLGAMAAKAGTGTPHERASQLEQWMAKAKKRPAGKAPVAVVSPTVAPKKPVKPGKGSK